MAGPRWVLGGAGRMDRLKTRGGRPPKKPVSDPSRPTTAQGEDRARSARRPLCLGATPPPGWLLGKAKTGSHGLAFFRCQSQRRSSRVVLTPASRRGALPVFEMTTPSCRKRRRTVHFRASPLVSSGTTTCKELQVLFSASQSLRSLGVTFVKSNDSSFSDTWLGTTSRLCCKQNFDVEGPPEMNTVA